MWSPPPLLLSLSLSLSSPPSTIRIPPASLACSLARFFLRSPGLSRLALFILSRIPSPSAAPFFLSLFLPQSYTSQVSILHKQSNKQTDHRHHRPSLLGPFLFFICFFLLLFFFFCFEIVDFTFVFFFYLFFRADRLRPSARPTQPSPARRLFRSALVQADLAPRWLARVVLIAIYFLGFPRRRSPLSVAFPPGEYMYILR